MGSRQAVHLSGLALLSPRLRDSLAPNQDGDPNHSSYSQAGPRPGLAVASTARSRLQPQISGDQGKDLEIVVLQSGSADLSLDAGVELGYRFAGETDEEIRGWSPPGMVMAWNSVAISTSASASNHYNRYDAVVLPSQKILCVYGGPSSVTRPARQRIWDPSTGEWGVESTPLYADSSVSVYTSLVVLADGRVLWLNNNTVWRSDDEGESWELHSRRPFGQISLAFGSVEGPDQRGRMARLGESIVFFVWDPAADELVQLASEDLLASFYEVGRFAELYGVSVAASDEAIFVAYIRAADAFPVCRRLNAAGQPLTDGGGSVIVEETAHEVSIVADPDGTLWAYVTDETTKGETALYVSIDGGDNWHRMANGGLRVAPDANDHLNHMKAVATAGAVHLLTNAVCSTETVDGTLSHAVLGGWSTLAAYGVPVISTAAVDTVLVNRAGYGPSSEYTNRCWVPIELPGNSTYNATGAGSEAITGGELEIDTTANSRFYDANFTVDAFEKNHSVIFDVVLDAGGDLADDDVVVGLRLADGTNDSEIRVRVGPTGIRAVDANAGTTLATEVLDTSEPLQIAVQVSGYAEGDADQAWVWYRRRHETTWTELWSGQLDSDTATPEANGRIVWGHVSSSTSTSRWRFVEDGAMQTLAQGPVRVVDSGLYEQVLGRPCNPRPSALPTETTYAAGDDWEGQACWLSAVAGPGGLGEEFEVDREFDFPVRNIDPVVSPSPLEKWRSRGLAEQVIAWDFEEQTWFGDSIVLACARANFRFASLEYSTGGGVWTEAGELDLGTGFEALTGDLVGDTLVPAASTAAGARYIQENELAGGHVLLETGGGAAVEARRIRGNTEGAWAGSGTSTVKVRIFLDGIDGTEDAEGEVALVWPSGVLIVHHSALQRRRRWRVRIPDTNVVAEEYFEAGCLVPAPLRAWGWPPDWGWSQEQSPNVETQRSRRGTTRDRSLGLLPNDWTFGWALSAADLTRLRQGIDQHYLGPASGLPLAAVDSTPWQLRAFFELQESGALPVVALATLPASGVTITDRSLFNVGRLRGSARQDHVLGSEGEGEVVRPASITIEGLV